MGLELAQLGLILVAKATGHGHGGRGSWSINAITMQEKPPPKRDFHLLRASMGS